MLIRNGKIDGARAELRVSSTIDEVGRELPAVDAEVVLDVRGAEILPGLHDHHIHFLAAAAALDSVDCGNVARDCEGIEAQARLREAFASAPGEWVRGVNYHESIAGDLDRHMLDNLISGRPARIQHRSGKLWILNSLAIDELGVAEESEQPGIEVEAGRPTGRLFRMDAWLRERMREVAPLHFDRFSRRLAACGITSFTDASYTNDRKTIALFEGATGLIQKFEFMGDMTLDSGFLKIMLDDDALPPLDELTATVEAAHERARNVAFHCVSHLELLFAMQLPLIPGDRIEHAGIVMDDMLDPMRDAGIVVATQPAFIAERGDQYLAALDDKEVPWLYRYRSLLDAGVPVLASSDAPYGTANPFEVAAAAAARMARSGAVINAHECVDVDEAMSGYLSRGGLRPGTAADLCVVADGWRQDPANACVLHTVVDGELVYSANS